MSPFSKWMYALAILLAVFMGGFYAGTHGRPSSVTEAETKKEAEIKKTDVKEETKATADTHVDVKKDTAIKRRKAKQTHKHIEIKPDGTKAIDISTNETDATDTAETLRLVADQRTEISRLLTLNEDLRRSIELSKKKVTLFPEERYHLRGFVGADLGGQRVYGGSAEVKVLGSWYVGAWGDRRAKEWAGGLSLGVGIK